MIDLFKTSTLVITPGAVGDYNAAGDWVDATQGASFEIQGSLQPNWKKTDGGISRDNLPAGVSVNDIRVIYTQTELNTSDIVGKAKADKTIIDSLPYYAYIKRDWSTFGLDLDHYEVFFVRDSEARP